MADVWLIKGCQFEGLRIEKAKHFMERREIFAKPPSYMFKTDKSNAIILHWCFPPSVSTSWVETLHIYLENMDMFDAFLCAE